MNDNFYDPGSESENNVGRNEYKQENVAVNRRLDVLEQGRQLGVLPKALFPSLRKNNHQQESFITQNELPQDRYEHEYDFGESEDYLSFARRAGASGIALLVIGLLFGTVILYYSCKKILQWSSRRKGRHRASRKLARNYRQEQRGKKKRSPYPRTGVGHRKKCSQCGYSKISGLKQSEDISESPGYSGYESATTDFDPDKRPKAYEVWKEVKVQSLNLAKQAENSLRNSTGTAVRASRKAAKDAYSRRGHCATIFYAIRDCLESCFYTTKRKMDPCLEYVEYYCDPCFGCIRVCISAIRNCIRRCRAPFKYTRLDRQETSGLESTAETSGTEGYSYIKPSAGPITIQPYNKAKSKGKSGVTRSGSYKQKNPKTSKLKCNKMLSHSKNYKRSYVSKWRHKKHVAGYNSGCVTESSGVNFCKKTRLHKMKPAYEKNKKCFHPEDYAESSEAYFMHKIKPQNKTKLNPVFQQMKNQNRNQVFESNKKRFNIEYTTESSGINNYQTMPPENEEFEDEINLIDLKAPNNFKSTGLKNTGFSSECTEPFPQKKDLQTAKSKNCDVFDNKKKMSLNPDRTSKFSNINFSQQNRTQIQNVFRGSNCARSNPGYSTESSGAHVPRCSGASHFPRRRCGLHCIQNNRNIHRDPSETTMTTKTSGVSSLASGDYITESGASRPNELGNNRFGSFNQSGGDAPTGSATDRPQLPKVLWQTKQGFQRENQRIEALMKQYEKSATACVIIDETSRRQRQNAARLDKISNSRQNPGRNRFLHFQSTPMKRCNLASKNLTSPLPISKSTQRLLHLRTKMDHYSHEYEHGETALKNRSNPEKNSNKLQKTPLSLIEENSPVADKPKYDANEEAEQHANASSIHTSEIDELISDGSVSLPTSNMEWTTCSDDSPKPDQLLDVTCVTANKPKFRSPSERFVSGLNHPQMSTKNDKGEERRKPSIAKQNNENTEKENKQTKQDSSQTNRDFSTNHTASHANHSRFTAPNNVISTQSKASESDRAPPRSVSSGRSAAEILQSTAWAFLTSDDDILSNEDDTYEEFWMRHNV